MAGRFGGVEDDGVDAIEVNEKKKKGGVGLGRLGLVTGRRACRPRVAPLCGAVCVSSAP
jgi:hypothetical protein